MIFGYKRHGMGGDKSASPCPYRVGQSNQITQYNQGDLHMSKRLAYLAALLRALDVQSPTALADRVLLQKRMYLLKICGADLGYSYSWDLYGPYSKTLAMQADYYTDDRQRLDTQAGTLSFTDSAKEAITIARQMMDLPPDTPEDMWLEALASFHFLANYNYRTDPPFRQQLEQSTDDDVWSTVRDDLLRRKPHLANLPTTSLREAWERVRPYVKPHDDLLRTAA